MGLRILRPGRLPQPGRIGKPLRIEPYDPTDPGQGGTLRNAFQCWSGSESERFPDRDVTIPAQGSTGPYLICELRSHDD